MSPDSSKSPLPRGKPEKINGDALLAGDLPTATFLLGQARFLKAQKDQQLCFPELRKQRRRSTPGRAGRRPRGVSNASRTPKCQQERTRLCGKC